MGICVAMEYFTKWPEAYVIPNQEATTVARVLVDQFFYRFDVPQELHSDQGRNFESAVFSECGKLLTTPLRPQSDGMVEKFNWTVGQELAKYCVEGQIEWNQKPPALLMAYWSAAHEYTQAKLMLGHELRLPVDLLTGRPLDELPLETTSYVEEPPREVEHHHVRGALEFSGEVKRNQDVKASHVYYKDLHTPQSPKLQSPR
ncbi:uncharacterized protein LOC121866326 [Homarus americanus]|uniref:uncharacterized protein LOC121866326 n=1 Tax=Homarus americanus TaxID=6706 RepID=UPI001C47DCB8|nr:uncharacterized protein LOC121866326 [Homarus americanus]